uniref:Uncharacterized protein n=1 Tax=Anguilla anguilla TaxID=7936 RepID=A0A0E9RYS6_ANGAN
MGTRKGKVQRLATVGSRASSTIQSISFFSKMAMLLGRGFEGLPILDNGGIGQDVPHQPGT